MTREMGSGGRDIAQRLADELGLKLVLHELVEHDLAEHMQVPESAVHHRLEGGATLRERLQVGSKRLARYTEEEILELARKGEVLIRGWGACVLLRGVPHVARIRICAPMELRVHTIMERSSSADAGAARREIEANDAAHKRLLRAAYGVDREDSLLYDLVLNTERNSLETCVKLARALVGSPEFRETAESRAILEDRCLSAHIRVKLHERFTAGTGVTGAAASVSGGKAVLTGTAIHATLAAEAGEIARAVAGVKEVENRIEVVRGRRAF
jgi:cytidylate kinase